MGPGRLGARRAEGQLLIETSLSLSLSLPLYTAAVTAIKKRSVNFGKIVIFRFVSLLS